MAEKPDFSQYSLDELNEIAEEAQEAITRRRAEALETARRAATEAAMKHGFSLRDLVETMPGMVPTKSKYPPNSLLAECAALGVPITDASYVSGDRRASAIQDAT